MKAIRMFVAVACLIVAVPLVAQSPMRTGQWEITSQMEMTGMPMKMPETKTMQCITPEQLKTPATTVPTGPDKSCQVSDYKLDGNKVTWKMACTGNQKMTGDGEMVFSGDTYTGKMNMAVPQGPQGPMTMTMKYTGKRIGDCTK